MNWKNILQQQASIKPEGEDLYKIEPDRLKKMRKEILLPMVGALGVALAIYIIFLGPPSNFPAGNFFSIDKGTSVSAAAEMLKKQSVIRYPALFKIFVTVFGRKGVIAGDYKFKRPLNVITVAHRMAIGQFDVEEIRVVIQEGMNNKEIATLLKARLPLFDDKHFLQIVSDKEGMLYPDTYFIKLSAKEGMVAEMLVNNFNSKIKTLAVDIQRSGHTLNEILTMASIIEKEANTKESRQMVSGILWERISQGMKLQVDAVFPYIMNKYSLQLTVKDLQYDSPYNTYKYKGLPPGPIANPGLGAIDAALHPKDSPYLYYLSDRAGNLYYAKTYTGHKANKSEYIGN